MGSPVHHSGKLAPAFLTGDALCLEDNFGGVPVTTETREVLKKVALRLEELRCHLEQCNPSDFDFSEAWETFGEICGAQVVAHESALGKLQYKLLGLIGRSQNQGAFLRGISRGFGLNLRQYLDALERREPRLLAGTVFVPV